MRASELAEASRRLTAMLTDEFHQQMIDLYLPGGAVVMLAAGYEPIRDLTCRVHARESNCVAVLEEGRPELTLLLCSVACSTDGQDRTVVQVRFWLPGQTSTPSFGGLTERDTIEDLLERLRDQLVEQM